MCPNVHAFQRVLHFTGNIYVPFIGEVALLSINFNQSTFDEIETLMTTHQKYDLDPVFEEF